MKLLLTMVLALCWAPAARADISFASMDLLATGQFTMFDVEGSGVDIRFTLVGGTVSEGTLDVVGSPIFGQADRLGWQIGGQSSFIATNDVGIQVEVLGGSATFGIGTEKALGAVGDQLVITRDDGFFSHSGGAQLDFATSSQFNEVGMTLEAVETFGWGLTSGSGVASNVPWVHDTTGFLLERPSIADFNTVDTSQWRLHLVSATPVPEPGALPLLWLATCWAYTRRCRHV